MNKLKHILFFVIWLFLFFVQQLVCFDVLDANLWYFYVIAVLCAGLQFLLIRKSITKVDLMRKACCIIYGLSIIEKVIWLLTYLAYASFSIGLTIVCLVINICGILLLFLANDKA